MEDRILIDYIKGVLDKKQSEQVMNWIESSKDNSIYFANLKARWILENFPNINLVDKETDFRIVQIFNNKRTKISLVINFVSKVAAILFIPLVVFTIYSNIKSDNRVEVSQTSLLNDNSANESDIVYYVDKGVKGKVTLPDGSVVWLNSNSKLKYTNSFNTKERDIELSGEAFFDVVSDSLKPMNIKTSKGIIVKVLGTSFNVSSYENDKDFRFTLFTGNAFLIKENTNQIINVKPSNEVIISDDSILNNKKKDDQMIKTVAWRDGQLIFEKTSMDEVIKKLERWYGVSFQILDKSILEFKFTASFDYEPIAQVMELLEITSNLNYNIEGKTIVLSSK